MNKAFTMLLLIRLLSGQTEININDLEKPEGIYIFRSNKSPATGIVFQLRNGKKEKMGKMKDGKKDGLWVEWHNYGRRLQETYKNGVLDGFVSIFYENGQKEWRHTYNNGVIEGNYTRWHKNGERAIDGFFENGIPVGVWAWRDESGNIIKKEKFKDKQKGVLKDMKEYIDKEIIK